MENQMKADLRADGFIWIIAETPSEAFALKHLTDVKPCYHCNQFKVPLAIDNTILDRGRQVKT
jgi:hypothetical protein